MEITKELLKRWIADYHWMVETLKLQREDSAYKGAKIAIYGVTSGRRMTITSNPVLYEVIDRDSKEYEHIKFYKLVIKEINNLSEKVKQNRDKYTLKRLLEGATLSDVAREVDLSVSSIFRSRERVLKDMMGAI